MHPKAESQHEPWENQSSPKRMIWPNCTPRFVMRSNATLTKGKPQKSFGYITYEKKSSRYEMTARPICRRSHSKAEAFRLPSPTIILFAWALFQQSWQTSVSISQ